MYKDSNMKRKEKKKSFRCEVSEFYKLVLYVNHVISLDIIFFWCDFHNVKVEFLTLLSSFSDCSDHLQFDIVSKFDIMHDLFRLFRLFRLSELFKQSVEKKIWWLWLVKIAVMKLHDLIWSSFEVHSWLSERLEVSFISVFNICDFVLNIKSLCFFTIHNFQHISFFMRFFFITLCYQNWELWFLNLFWIEIWWCQMKLSWMKNWNKTDLFQIF